MGSSTTTLVLLALILQLALATIPSRTLRGNSQNLSATKVDATASTGSVLIGENGDVTQVVLEPSSFLAATGSAYTIEQCFESFCESASVKQHIVDACHKGGYPNCDSMKYKGTYHKHGSTPTFSAATKMNYGSPQTHYTEVNEWHETWNNTEIPRDQSLIFSHTITNRKAQTWTNSVESKLSSSLTISETAGLPGVCQEHIDATITAEIDVSSTRTVSKTSTQSDFRSQTINVPANFCEKGCMNEKIGDMTVPYTITGNITANFSELIDRREITFAGQCCYLRPGGSGSCGYLDKPGSTSGWSILFVPGTPAQSSVKQCAGFGKSGDNATFSVPGKFSGGFGVNISIATVKCTSECVTPN